MAQGFTFGSNLIRLDEVESTNTFLQELSVAKTLLEGTVVVAKNQTKGRGQRGSNWETEANKNLTFSLLLKPNIVISEQFLISKLIALGIYDFLKALKIKNVVIKWPNDILVSGKKIAGILIENTLKNNKVSSVIVGVGLNINQTQFSDGINATSLMNEVQTDLDIDETLQNLLIYLEKRYLQLRALNYNALNTDYLNHLLGYQTKLRYQIDGRIEKGTIVGITSEGKLQLSINGLIREFGMKEVSFII